ncbi:MAG: type II toxin-antitoxin system ParD family antitoxin [Desulfurococcales archaeon]|nr:type II toxin-antitoxin system ParD family antitoxin [Desulfurococcales archaeon]
MRLVTVKIPEIYLEGIDELVKLGRYSSRSEVIRTAIRDLLKKELWFSDKSEEFRHSKNSIALVRRVRLV